MHRGTRSTVYGNLKFQSSSTFSLIPGLRVSTGAQAEGGTFQATIQFNFYFDFPGVSCDQIQKEYLGIESDGIYSLNPTRNAPFAVRSNFSMLVIIFV